jgi:hypothetical protein
VRPAGSARYRPTVDSDGNERVRKSGPDVRSRRATVQAGQAIVELQRVIGFDRRPRRPRDVEPRLGKAGRKDGGFSPFLFRRQPPSLGCKTAHVAASATNLAEAAQDEISGLRRAVAKSWVIDISTAATSPGSPGRRATRAAEYTLSLDLRNGV